MNQWKWFVRLRPYRRADEVAGATVTKRLFAGDMRCMLTHSLAWLVNTPTNSHSKKYWPYNLHNTLCGVRTFASTMCIWYTFCYTFVSLLFISSVYRARAHTAYLTWGCATNGYRNLIKAKIKKKSEFNTKAKRLHKQILIKCRPTVFAMCCWWYCLL